MNDPLIETRREILQAASDEFSAYWFALHEDFPHTLWHYTDAGALLGMLQYQQLWFTDAQFLNDHSEMSYALKVIEQIIGEHLKNESYSPVVVEYLKDMLMSAKARVSADRAHGFMNPAFVCCFCKEKDSLHLWRAYANNGRGYSIGFYPDFIFNRMPPVRIKELAVSNKKLVETWFWLDPYFCRVIYSFDEQCAIIGKLVETFVNAINKNPDCFPLGQVNNFSKSAALGKIYSLFYLCLFCFKDPSFTGEQEWRIVYARRFGPDDGIEKLPESVINYRVSGNYFIPYLKVDAGREIEIEQPKDTQKYKKLVFETIVAGPALDYELARATVFSYAYRNFYLGTNLNVQKSEVPLRSMQ